MLGREKRWDWGKESIQWFEDMRSGEFDHWNNIGNEYTMLLLWARTRWWSDKLIQVFCYNATLILIRWMELTYKVSTLILKLFKRKLKVKWIWKNALHACFGTKDEVFIWWNNLALSIFLLGLRSAHNSYPQVCYVVRRKKSSNRAEQSYAFILVLGNEEVLRIF